MGTVREISKGKFKLTAELGYVGNKRKRKNKTVSAKNKTEAKKILTQFEAELMAKHHIDDSKLSIKNFYDQWLEKFARDHYGIRTLVETKSIIENRFLPEFGDMKLVDVRKIHLIDFFDDLKKNGKRLDGKEGGLSPSSIKNIYKAINSLFKVAVQWDLIEKNPSENMSLPKVSHKKSEVFTLNETNKLFELLSKEDPMWQLIVQVAAVLGAREGEIVALEDKHLDTANNAITIEQAFVNVTGEGVKLKSTKSDRTRKVSIPEGLMDELKKLRSIKYSHKLEVGDLWKYPDNVFLFSDEFGQPRRPDSISQRWYRLTRSDKYEKSGLKKIRFHDLRHTSATLLISKGVHAKIIQERLGHSRIATTMDIYGHVLQEAEQSAAQHFNELYKKG
ncbi:hypothetical protein AQ616_19040 [Oceanobacillus sp. E9]|uniref:tyrosine-type recombinase/integrase n=1 Tax=Oceanobacillus sp. E9 TaxID=1742575 RepID=UPI00084E9C6C|nr:site-specific integrase [Oceanobacillus sp. E9]OEH55934.1 hypothetical protein AQ616_19040 [Oceanobacillus sp. E9]